MDLNKKIVLIKKYQKEFLFLLIVFLLGFIDRKLAATYFGIEVFFIITLGAAIFFRVRKNFKISFRAYLLNRLIGFLQPMITLILMLIGGYAFFEYWYVYLALITDLILTIVSLTIFNDHFSEIKVRVARESDISALHEIEVEVFTLDQQASIEQIKKRLQTHYGTCLVAEHHEQGIIGSLYVRTINKAQVIAKKSSHKEIQNNDDFSFSPDHDALYIVGLQAKKISGIPVAKFLEASIARFAMKQDFVGVLGGPRLPEYHAFPEMDLEEFIRSKYAKLLNYIVKIGNIPGVCKVEIICGLKNYFPDPDSLNCAALVCWSTPLLWTASWFRKSIADLLYAIAIF
jgi:hypothetical protein